MIRHMQERDMRRNIFFLFLLGISVACTACKANAPEQPTPVKTAIEIIAVVYKIDTSPDGILLRVRQLDKQFTTPESQGVVIVTEASEVVDKTEGKAKKATPQFLAVGQKISVLVETVQESIPWVARAVKVEVLTSGTLETGDPILQGLNPDLTGRYQGLKKITVDGVERTVMVVDSVKLSQHPQVNEINLVPSIQMTIWRLVGNTYHEVDLDSLMVGSQISVLLIDRLGYPGDYPIDGEILEIIIRDE